MTTEGAQALAAGILERAIKDWCAARRKQAEQDEPSWEGLQAARLQKEVEQFFRSKWFGVLSDLDPEALIEKLNEMYPDGEKRICRGGGQR